MKKNTRKPIIALILAIAIACGSVVCASAGSLNNLLGKGWDYVWGGMKIVKNAFKDTAVYLFTDDDAETAYRSTKESVCDLVIEEIMIKKNVDQVKKDADDVVEGTKKMAEGAKEFIQSTNSEDTFKLLTGEGLQNEEQQKALDKMKNGSKGETTEGCFWQRSPARTRRTGSIPSRKRTRPAPGTV